MGRLSFFRKKKVALLFSLISTVAFLVTLIPEGVTSFALGPLPH